MCSLLRSALTVRAYEGWVGDADFVGCVWPRAFKPVNVDLLTDAQGLPVS